MSRTEPLARAAGGLAAMLLLWVPAGFAAGSTLASGYVEGAWADSGRLADGGRSSGHGFGLRLPFADNAFFTASATTLDGYVDAFGLRTVDEQRRSIGFGLSKGRPDSEQYARLVYIDIKDWRGGYPEQDARGGALSFGGRAFLLGSYLEGTIEGGFGMIRGEQGSDGVTFAGRGELALQLGRSFTLYAARIWEDTSFWQAGVRLNFAHLGKRSRPAVRAAGDGSGPLLAAGNSLVVRRALQLQVRPAFGAPETQVVPAGETLSLLESTRNDFGNWWRVSWNGQEGWIREGWLLRAE